MNWGSTFRRALLGTGLAAAAMTPSLAADPARELLEKSVNEVLAIVYDRPDEGKPLSVRVRPVLEQAFDLEYTTRSAIGPGWRQFTPEQRTRAIELFSEVVIRTYADRFEPGPRPTIDYGRTTTPAESRRQIPTTVTYEGENYAVAYKFRETPDGWLIYDVIIENVSMIANYRAQFEELFRKGGAKEVLRALEENLRQVEAGGATSLEAP